MPPVEKKVRLSPDSSYKIEKRGFDEAGGSRFFDGIGRPDLKEIITPQAPWVYYSMGIAYGDLPAAGGLEFLAGDLTYQNEKNRVPFVGVTLIPRYRWDQSIENFTQQEKWETLDPKNCGFKEEPIGEIPIHANGDTINVGVYELGRGRAEILGLHESGIKELYYGSNNCDHRLYQECLLGFAGYQALKMRGYTPSVLHLNEAATTSAGIAHLDDLCAKGMSFDQALRVTRDRTILTNHTLVQAADATFSKDQYENYIAKNIQSEAVRNWLEDSISKDGGRLDLSAVAFRLAGKINGVSHLHAKTANGNWPVECHSITNGIYLDRWGDPDYLALDRSHGVIDQFDLPTEDYREKIDRLDPEASKLIKDQERIRLREFLATQPDQYGQPVVIPEGAITIAWARRIAEYKRPGLALKNPNRLAEILKNADAHYLMAGRLHPDERSRYAGHVTMREELERLFRVVDGHPELRKRFHFVQNYREELGRNLTSADVWVNTPRRPFEASGTSGMKAIAKRAITVSIEDGFFADEIPSKTFLKITGENENQEAESLYSNLERATALSRSDPENWSHFVNGQLKSFYPTISGARMTKDYLDFRFPKVGTT